MSSTKQITLDYSRTVALTEEINALAEKLKNEINVTTENNIGNLVSGWEGENASEFVRKISELMSNSSPAATRIGQLADSIRASATALYNAEMEAIRIAQSRGSGVGGAIVGKVGGAISAGVSAGIEAIARRSGGGQSGGGHGGGGGRSY